MFHEKSITNCANLLSKLHCKLESELPAVRLSNVILIDYIDCQIDVQLIKLVGVCLRSCLPTLTYKCNQVLGADIVLIGTPLEYEMLCVNANETFNC